MSEDGYAGTPDNPPSLHRYLYVYQNPTVYVDPDGNAAYLASGQEFDDYGAQLYRQGNKVGAAGVAIAGAFYKTGTGFFTFGQFDEANQAVTQSDTYADAARAYIATVGSTAEEIATEYATEGAVEATATVGGKFVCGRMRQACDTAGKVIEKFASKLIKEADGKPAGELKPGGSENSQISGGNGGSGGQNSGTSARNTENKLENASVADVPKETNYLYRGVSAKHPELDAAKKGVVVPGNLDGSVSPDMHNAGGHAANSPFTSWTHDSNTAAKHAAKHGDGGLVLRVPQGAPPKDAQWSWEWSPDIYGEQEVLMRGVRTDAEVFK